MEIKQPSPMKTKTKIIQEVKVLPYTPRKTSYRGDTSKPEMSREYLDELSYHFKIPLHGKYFKDGKLVNALSHCCNKDRKLADFSTQNNFHEYNSLILSKHAIAHLEDRGYWIELMHIQSWSTTRNNHVSNLQVVRD